MRRRKQNGQAIVLVVLAVGLVLAGAMGLAVDAGQLYGHRQMAQAAADAAAQAGITSVYAGTNTGTNAFGTATYTCANGTDTTSPCGYGRRNGFGATASSTDTVIISFPTSVPGVTLSPDFTPAAVHALITRNVDTTLMRLIGAPSTMAVKASATAVITAIPVAIPIIITHPTLQDSLQLQGGGGGNSIVICGGPSQSIQVNSNNQTEAAHVQGSSTIDLSKAGPADDGNCNTGTGADFGTFGAPAFPTTPPSWLTPFGTTEHYLQPSLPIPDPFFKVSEPSVPANAPTPDSTSANTFAGVGDCPASAKQGSNPAAGDCTYYSPGNYSTGIQVKTTTAVFKPGLYYISGAPNSGTFKDFGFATGSNGGMVMCSTLCGTSVTDFTSKGMLVFLSTAGGVLHVPANSTVSLLGSDQSGTYKGLLFFSSRSAPTHTGIGSVDAHLLGGGGAMTLQGTIYLTNCDMTHTPTCSGTAMSSSNYQVLQLSGGSGSGTLIQGEIVVSVLQIGGGGAIKMNLNPAAVSSVNQIALVQ